MTATNINIDQFITVLIDLRNRGHMMIDLDMIPDENHPSMNKLVVHPVITQEQQQQGYKQPVKPTEINNPNISTKNNDIFDAFGL